MLMSCAKTPDRRAIRGYQRGKKKTYRGTSDGRHEIVLWPHSNDDISSSRFSKTLFGRRRGKPAAPFDCSGEGSGAVRIGGG